MESTKYLSELHAEHLRWIELMHFYTDELASFSKRLAEVVMSNPRSEVKAEIEHFQNQFIRQKEVLDILLHDIKISEKKLEYKVSLTPDDPTERKRLLDEPKLREQVEIFTKIYTDLKEEFKLFLVKSK